jgi:hypothetical protein
MKTKKIEVCDAIFIDITCIRNDSVDIRCGGPATLGYEFYVSPDENIDELKKFLEGCIKKYHRPFMGITVKSHENFPVEHLWTREKMEKCIKENDL